MNFAVSIYKVYKVSGLIQVTYPALRVFEVGKSSQDIAEQMTEVVGHSDVPTTNVTMKVLKAEEADVKATELEQTAKDMAKVVENIKLFALLNTSISKKLRVPAIKIVEAQAADQAAREALQGAIQAQQDTKNALSKLHAQSASGIPPTLTLSTPPKLAISQKKIKSLYLILATEYQKIFCIVLNMRFYLFLRIYRISYHLSKSLAVSTLVKENISGVQSI